MIYISHIFYILYSPVTLFSDCLGVLDCEWCVFDNDGETRLSPPFCSTQRVCFAGVLEASTPYHDEINGNN